MRRKSRNRSVSVLQCDIARRNMSRNARVIIYQPAICLTSVCSSLTNFSPFVLIMELKMILLILKLSPMPIASDATRT